MGIYQKFWKHQYIVPQGNSSIYRRDYHNMCWASVFIYGSRRNYFDINAGWEDRTE
jgi:hypothetical protein